MRPAHSAHIIIPKYLEEYFEELEKEHGITLTLPQKRWYTMKYKELGEQIRQEYPSTPEESFMGSSEGFWYLREMNIARQDKRITEVPFQTHCLVNTAWDIGYDDPTAIWFFQKLPSGAVHIIDYYENNTESIAHYVGYLNTLKYRGFYDKHYMPHDAGAHEKGSGLSLAQQAKDLGLDVIILNRYNPSKSSFIMEIQRTRDLINRCYFDEGRCAQGIKCLENYRKKWNESMGTYTREAVHDAASHAADAFRYLSQALGKEERLSDTQKMEEERRKIKLARRFRI